MRIVHCITKGDVGGAQAVVEALAREQLRDHRVDIATGLVGPMCDALRVAGATIHHVPQLVHPPDPRQSTGYAGRRR